jgi:hypothetical protein
MIKRFVGWGVGVLVTSSLLCGFSEGSKGREVYSQAIEKWFEAEIWRAGGPRPEKVLQFFEGIVAAGKVNAVFEASRHISSLLDHGWFDGNLLWRFVPLLANVDRRGTIEENNDISELFREQLVLATMSDADRLELYRRTLKEGSVRYDVGPGANVPIGWENAAMAALWVHFDELVPDIEAALAAHKGLLKSTSAVPYIEDVLLPLAQARRTTNWVDAYMDLVREAVASQADHPEMNPTSVRNRLIREALLELVHTNQQVVAGQLISLYEDPHESPARAAAATCGGAQAPATSLSGQHTGPAAQLLARAAKALGKPVPEESRIQSFAPSEAEAAERSLIRDGYLKRPPAQDAGPK